MDNDGAVRITPRGQSITFENWKPPASSLSGYSRQFVCKGAATPPTPLPGSVKLFTEEFFQGKWEMPDGAPVAVADEIALPRDLAAGRHRLLLGVVGEGGERPAVRLGIAGRDADGWYPLSTVEIRR